MRFILLTNFDIILITIVPILVCIIAIGYFFRKLLSNRKDYNWQPETDHDLIYHEMHTGNMNQHTKMYLRSKDPKIHAKYFVPKAKEK